jgi:hypothetical protein
MGEKAMACVPSADVDARRAVCKAGLRRRYSLNRRVEKEGVEKDGSDGQRSDGEEGRGGDKKAEERTLGDRR